MGKTTRYVGMDVHAATIAVAMVDGRGVARSLATIENRPEAVRQLIKKLGEPASGRVCYEAGQTGYVLYWQLTKLGVHCEVVAPSLVPVKSGNRIKTDRRDALRLASVPQWRPNGGVGAAARARGATRSSARS